MPHKVLAAGWKCAFELPDGPALRNRVVFPAQGDYDNHMKTTQLKVTRIGNSRGVRLPATVLRRYRIGGAVLMEQKTEGILLRPTGPAVEKLSWEQTAREMAANPEDWREWDAAAGDGLATVPRLAFSRRTTRQRCDG